MSHRFGDIRQVAYLVKDIDKAMRHWTGVLGIGPFFYVEKMTAHGSTFRGQPTSPQLSLAMSQSGPMQIELIQQHNDAPSQFLEYKQAGFEGQHHIAFWTKEFDGDMARYLKEGYEILSTANTAPNRNAFLTAAGHNGTLIEISEISGAKGEYFEKIARIATSWDGKNPLRKVARMTPDAIDD
ncbi:MAG: VOC family protein [Betaproteobacteria bacterium]|nr:VOC family protein [Betaproteobacteria bacterium]